MKSHIFAIVFISAASGAFAAPPAGYYNSCEGKGGKSLLTALHQKIGDHTVVSYDGLWDLYRTSDVRENGRIWDMYSTKEWAPGTSQCGNYKLVGDCYNREHSFPKSWFSEGKPMASDAFHIYPTDGKVNSQRSNYPYGECSGGTTLPSNGGVKALGRLGTSTFPGYSGVVFEPDDEYKGDFARSYFYMAAAYMDKIANWDSKMLAGNNFPAFSSWAVNLLLKWHRQDPVSKKELDRQEAVYARQKNRNPFIDHPELVEYIWGDKASLSWSASGTAEPALNTPANGSAIVLGITAPGFELERSVTVKTTNATSNVTLSAGGAGFSVTPASFTASLANAGTAQAVVKFKASATGKYSGTLVVACGSLRNTVTLSAEVVSGVPLSDAANITDTSFDARWTYVGDADASGNYTLVVTDALGAPVSGYPRAVNARAGIYTVDNLEPSTEYRFSLRSQTLESKVLSARTAAPIPDIAFLFEGDLFLRSEPGKPSPEAEILIELENIDEAYSVSIGTPFQLSLDKQDWSTQLMISPEEDRLYLRMFGDKEGEYESSLIARVGEYINDDAVVRGEICAPEADFFETFENYASSNGTYNAQHYQGTACAWQLEDTGMWPSDQPHSGSYCLRGGRSSKAVIAMDEDRSTGIGTLRFWARRWNGDATPELDVMVSTNGGTTWSKIETLIIESQDYTEYSCPVNTRGRARIKLDQSAGKRFMLDDLTLTSYTTGLENPEAEHNQWDAWCPAPGVLRVSSTAEVSVSVYAIDGRTLRLDVPVRAGEPLDIAGLEGPEVYIVATGDFARRVLVK